MNKALAVLLAAGLAAPALAEDRPLTKPSRDVDVTYAMAQMDAPGGPRLVQQRMRWAVADGKLRVDPPSPGLWMVMDYKAHRMTTVQDGPRTLMVMDTPTATMDPGAAGGGRFLRRGTAEVAGLACTEWETKDVSGTPTLACLTADGVLLRAIAAGRILLEAARVTYGPLDQSVFRVPDGYRAVTPPPLDGKTPR